MYVLSIDFSGAKLIYNNEDLANRLSDSVYVLGYVQPLHFYQWNLSSTSRKPKRTSIQPTTLSKMAGPVETSASPDEVEV